MPCDRPREYRRLAAECIASARDASDAQRRASFADMAQRWIDLAELAEHDPYQSLRRRAIQAAIGDELKSLYWLSHSMPPHFLALLANLNAAENKVQNGGWGDRS
jgi:hypothetical protein